MLAVSVVKTFTSSAIFATTQLSIIPLELSPFIIWANDSCIKLMLLPLRLSFCSDRLRVLIPSRATTLLSQWSHASLLDGHLTMLDRVSKGFPLLKVFCGVLGNIIEASSI
jgi:hypothetical protein